jgi:hypothetical protein
MPIGDRESGAFFAAKGISNLYKYQNAKRKYAQIIIPPFRRDFQMKSISCSCFGLLLFVFLLMLLVPSLQGQQTIIHTIREFTLADGVTAEDADQVKNGIVVWKGGGTVHVVTGFFVGSGQTLEIQQGAIIKVAAAFETANGQLLWKPPDGTTAITCNGDMQQPSGLLKIESATITDIRDDAVGGDTNQDGSSSTVPAPANIAIRLDLGGNADSYIKHSTLKYVERMINIGGLTISDNHFIMFGSLTNTNLTSNPPFQCLDTAPELSGNVFEFARAESGGSPVCGVSLLGLSPIIQNNTFRYAAGYAKAPNYSSYATALFVGHWEVAGRYYPESGITQIRNNRFETGGGISVAPLLIYRPAGGYISSMLLHRFRAEIINNIFVAPTEVGGSGGKCLILPLAAEVKVNDNTISNYFRVVDCDSTGRTTMAGLFAINHNRFQNCSFFTVIADASKKYFINAENNYWGDPSGPYDPSNADGLYNPRGKGTRVPDGVDYSPFTGGSRPAKENISITAIAVPNPPFVPGTTVSVTITEIKYLLTSSPTGKIYFFVRDKDGFILNDKDQPIQVTAENTTAGFVSLQVKVPELGKTITVEASLVPDGRGEGVKSNVVSFAVAAPPSAFAILEVKDVTTGVKPAPIRGNQLQLRIDFRYTYTAGKVVMHVAAKERRVGSGEIINSFSPVATTFASGTNKTDNIVVPLDIPLRDVQQFPNLELFCQISMKTENGMEIGKDDKSFIILPAGTVRWEYFAAGAPSGSKLIPIGRLYYIVGEYHAYGFRMGYDVKTKGATGWSIWAGEDEALDSNGNVLYRFTATGPALTNIATGSQSGLISSMGATNVLPPGTKRLRAHLQLKAADNTLVADATYDVEVRDQPVHRVQKSVPPGSSQQTFSPTPAVLSFSSNQKAGTAFVDEYSDPFSAPAALAKSIGAIQSSVVSYWKFIPLLRYWSVYDTLKEGTYQATLKFVYEPATDFPNDAAFREDSLVIAGFNRMSKQLEALPSTLDKSTHSISTEYSNIFDTWVVASRMTMTLATHVSMERPSVFPDRFVLYQNYPNPFNAFTSLCYQIPESCQLKLAVYDLLGREVAVLAEGKKDAGVYTSSFDGTRLGSGVYFYRMDVTQEAKQDLFQKDDASVRGKSYTYTKKLLLVK